MRKILLFIVLATIAMTFTVSALALSGSLKEKIQEELDGNLFLEKERIRLRVVEEKNGYVTIEVYEGPRFLREAIYEGFDIERFVELDGGFAGMFAEITAADRRGVTALKKALAYVRRMTEVKKAMLVAAVNMPVDRAEDLAKKAEQGDVGAQATLGWMYVKGEGVAKDYLKAVKWFGKAAEQGDASAQANLAWIYAKGKGVATDYAKAVKWFRKAAEQGNAKGQNGLAWFYATSPIPKYRNARGALEYAQQIVSKEPEKWSFVSTLAAAYARNHEFDKAVVTEQKAFRLLQKYTGYPARKKQQKLDESKNRIELYRQRQPYTATKGY